MMNNPSISYWIKRDEPATQVAEIVADVTDEDPANLPTMWKCTDGVLDHLFSTPPSPEAHMSVGFNYAGHRITVYQDGVMELLKVEHEEL